jgi:hypothetical protein
MFLKPFPAVGNVPTKFRIGVMPECGRGEEDMPTGGLVLANQRKGGGGAEIKQTTKRLLFK